MHEGEIYLFIIGSYYIAIWTERSIIHYSLFRKTKKETLNNYLLISWQDVRSGRWL